MKIKASRLLSLILALSIILSCFTVFCFAAEEEEQPSPDLEELVVMHNRDYADGWGIYNGCGNEKSHKKDHNFYIAKELKADYSYNYFARFEAADTFAVKGAAATDGFTEYSVGISGHQNEGHIVAEFDIKTDDITSLGDILYFRAEGGSANGATTKLLSLVDNKLYPFANTSYKGYDTSSKWVHVVIDIDYTNPANDPERSYDISISMDGEAPTVKTINAKLGYAGADIFRFGLPPVSSEADSIKRAGQGYGLDNLQLYWSANGRASQEDINAQGYGKLVDLKQAKTENISDGSEIGKSVSQIVKEESLCMKINVNYALLNGKQVNIKDGTYGAPVIYNDKIVVPFDIILEYMNTGYFVHEDGMSYDISTGASATYLTMGRSLATVGGKVVELSMAPGYYTDPKTGSSYAVVALDDVEKLLPGYFVTYDDMGLIIISTRDEIVDRENGLNLMIDAMEMFVFNFLDADAIYEAAKESTNNFTHPYVLGNQETFDRMYAIYSGADNKDYGVPIKSYITSQVDRSYHFYNSFGIRDVAKDEDGNVITDADGNPVYLDTRNTYNGLDRTNSELKTLDYPHVATNGYDPDGGRQAESGTVTAWAQDIAFGYAVTKDIRLAQMSYDILVAVGEWNHWCPGHFLNTSDAARAYTLALDWIYNGIVELQSGVYDDQFTAPDGRKPSQYYKLDYVESLLYKNGLRMGYLVSTFQDHGWVRNQGNVCYYTSMDSNWNAVCTSGMVATAFYMMGSELSGPLGPNEGYSLQLGPTDGDRPYKETAAWLIEDNLQGLALNGMIQYAPDGSYIEGPGYWGYGTNNVFFTAMCLWNMTGDDLGLLDAAGMDKTCYYACCVESSDYNQFSYHDSGENAAVDTKAFYFVSMATNDPVLAEIRKLHNNNGKGMNIWDLFFFPYDSDSSNMEVELPLDYRMEGISASTSRASWEKGSLFVGMIAGNNSANHGQIDCGSFVYDNAGTRWISDIGSDNYNAYEYFGASRYRYYRMNAEGHNVVFIASKPKDMPYGQSSAGGGFITDFFYNDFGSVTITDNTSAYGGFAASAKRGMMLTNDRKTVVIQDEIDMLGVETLYWAAHINTSKVGYQLINGGRGVILNDLKTGKMVRLTIVSNSSYEKFIITTAGETEEDRLLKGDKGTVDYTYSYAMGSNVGEKSRANLKRLLVKAHTNTLKMAVVIEMVDRKDAPVYYNRFVPMSEWKPQSSEDSNTPVIDTTENRGPAKLSNISVYTRNAASMYETGRGYTTKIEDYFRALSFVHYTQRNFYPEDLVDYENQLRQYESMKAEYDVFVKTINNRVKATRSVAHVLAGI